MLNSKLKLKLSQKYLLFEIVNNYFYPSLNVEFLNLKLYQNILVIENLLLFCLFKENN